MATPGRAGRVPGNRAPVRVDGLTEAKAALALLPEEFRIQAAETIDVGTAIMESEARNRVPYDEGDLDRSIGRNVREDGLQASVGTPLPHGRFQELGTEHNPAQPWLYPAFRVGARFIRREMKEWTARVGRKVSVRARRRKVAK